MKQLALALSFGMAQSIGIDMGADFAVVVPVLPHEYDQRCCIGCDLAQSENLSGPTQRQVQWDNRPISEFD